MKKFVALFFAVLPTVCSLHAAPFLWSSPQNVLGNTDVNTQGTLFQAANVVGSDTTINGVTFANFAAVSGTTYGNFTITGTSNGFTGYGSANAPFSNLSSAYQSLLGSGNYGGGNSLMTLTISGLSVGQSYLFQFWINDSRESIAGQAVTATTGASSVTLDADTTDTNGGIGQYATGTFVADATTQTVDLQGLPTTGTLVNGFQLRAVPEPASVALLALSGSALLFAPRRKS